MIKKTNLLILLFLIIQFPLIGGEEQVLISRANKAYSEGHYEQAIELYKKVITAGFESSDLYYNLGNAHFKLNEFSPAILNYEKAHKMDPGDEDINYNLSVANSKIADKIEPLPELFYKRWFRSVRELMSVDEWGKIFISAMVLALVSGFIYFVSNRLFIRKVGFWTGVSLMIIALFSFFLAYQNFKILKNNQEAIIFSPTVTIKSSPDEKSVDLFVLHEGTKVKIVDHIGGWFEIKIANGSVGWLPASSIEKI